MRMGTFVTFVYRSAWKNTKGGRKHKLGRGRQVSSTPPPPIFRACEDFLHLSADNLSQKQFFILLVKGEHTYLIIKAKSRCQHQLLWYEINNFRFRCSVVNRPPLENDPLDTTWDRWKLRNPLNSEAKTCQFQQGAKVDGSVFKVEIWPHI